VIVRAVLTGLLVAVVVTYPWAYLVDLNTRHWTAVPWAVVPTAIWLAIWWRYISGHGWPASTSSARRAALRARNVSDDQWGSALLAGILGLAASLAILNLTNRWLPVPQESLANSVLSRIPAFTVIISTLMGSAVASIV